MPTRTQIVSSQAPDARYGARRFGVSLAWLWFLFGLTISWHSPVPAFWNGNVCFVPLHIGNKQLVF